jgi:hypothetical protein
MNFLKFQQLLAAVSLVASGLQMAACSRQEPKPEKDVVFQSSGHFSLTDGPEFEAFVVVRNTKKTLTLEIRENKTQALLATGLLPGEVVGDLFVDLRGPLRSMIHSSTMHVAQDCSLKRVIQSPQIESATAAVGLTGPSGNSSPTAPQTLVMPSGPIVLPIVTEGMLEFSGTRNIEYNTGLLQRWMDGMLTVKFKSPSGDEAARFTGMIARQIINRENVFAASTLAVGASVAGTMRTLGDLGTGGKMDQIDDVILSLALPFGAGKIESDGGYAQAIVFEFDPKTDVTPPEGLGQLKGIKQSESLVEATDVFVGKINLPAADIRGGLTGKGTANVDYDLKISVDPRTITVAGRIFIHADLAGENGAGKRSFDATGTRNNVQTTLDW